jgi:hypothetical protein
VAVDLEKLNTGINAVNAFTNYKSMQSLKELVSLCKGTQRLQEFQLEKTDELIGSQKQMQQTSQDILDATKHNLLATRQISEEMRRQDNEKKLISLKKDLFFNIRTDLDELKESDKTNLEKFIFSTCLEARLLVNKIDTSISDDIQDKKIIDECMKDIKSTISDLEQILSSEEKQDFQAIIQFLEVSEEAEIARLREKGHYKFYYNNQITLDEIKNWDNNDVYGLVSAYGQLLQEEEKPLLNYDIKKDGGKNGFYELLDPEYTDTEDNLSMDNDERERLEEDS